MSQYTVITEGFGSFGTVNFVITEGYSSAALAPGYQTVFGLEAGMHDIVFGGQVVR